MRTAFIYTDRYADYDYGLAHPLRIVRLKLTYELIKAYGLLALPSTRFVETREATEEELFLFHSRDYVDVLKRASQGSPVGEAFMYGLGPGDNPIFDGLWEWSLLATGASIQGARLVVEKEVDIAFNVAGGLHHAFRDRASGFCYVNDPVITILWLLEQGKRVAYIDIDAHHGDGVQRAFYGTDRVMTISLHESGNFLFPGSGFEYEMGEGEGEGYSVNVPLYPLTDDETYLWAFEEVVPPLIGEFKPDVMVTQLGVDTFYSDPLTHLCLTTRGFTKVIEKLRDLSIPWVALGGGGYEVGNVARAWTLAWAIMNGVELEDEIPGPFEEIGRRLGLREDTLRDVLLSIPHGRRQEARMEAERVVNYLKRAILSESKDSP
ncbi:MAG: acetoin utilization protein AcuC [Deltaproteobacteria bacterium]|nr:acetoin utilization protein AcuC [Deltaproteobacteria bacterium]